VSVSARFGEFFEQATGRKPYPWQCELVERVAARGVWPDICAPTGAGKSAVIEAHVFLVGEHRLGHLVARPPRRMVLVSPRRALVDDQYDRACSLAERLAGAAREQGNTVLQEIARALLSLQTSQPPARLPFLAWSLRGGMVPDNGWRLEPAACQVICATPQMWGSRLLFRGYGASRSSRNLEAGLLGHDAVVVVDEAHLHPRLIDSARVVAAAASDSRRLQVVAMSATQRPAVGQLGLQAADLDDHELAVRVQACKRVEVVEVDGWGRELQKALVRCAVTALGGRNGHGTVGVFVNDVPSALGVADQLRRMGHVVEVVCGRMRGADLADLRKRRPGLLTPEGDAEVQFLISTQSLEVGVDLDLPAMISVIAPAAALAQRAGRLNRSGRHAGAVFTVVVPSKLDEAANRDGAGPYATEELQDALPWLQGLGGSITPLSVSSSELPASPRPLLPALRTVELETLAMSSDRHSADPDADFYLLDPSEETPEVGVVARRHLDLDPTVVAAALTACPPREHELASLPWSREKTSTLGRVLEKVGEQAWVIRQGDGSEMAEPFRAEAYPRPGDVIVVPHGAAICTAGVVGMRERRTDGDPLNEVLEQSPASTGRDWVLPIPAAVIEPILTDDPVVGTRAGRRKLADVVAQYGDTDCAYRLRTHARLADLEVTWCGGEPGVDTGLLVVREMVARTSDIQRTVPERLVGLEEHQLAVERRLACILEALVANDERLPADALLLAAREHDQGKRHPRFQARMGAREELLAKPRPGYRPDRGDGWRHEQLSAAYAARASGGDALTVALVGSHHGRGRPLFDRVAPEVIDDWEGCESAVRDWVWRLFGDCGEYEILRQQAQRRFGIYGLAWLEALLRCADMQVSREGS